jgi:hypothetical protein
MSGPRAVFCYFLLGWSLIGCFYTDSKSFAIFSYVDASFKKKQGKENEPIDQKSGQENLCLDIMFVI